MVFFANSYIEARKEEQKEHEDRKRALLLMSQDPSLSHESAMRKVREFRMREEAGLVDTVQKVS